MTTTDTAGFIPATIRDKDMVQAMALFSTPYARPREAVLREIAVNARDAHIAAGIDAPISVQLPMVEISGVGDDTTYTVTHPELVVRDEGAGMNAKIVTDVFTNFVASTKRDQPGDETGWIGIGATSPYGLTDHFFVETVHGGVFTRAELKLIDGHSHVRITTEETDQPCGTTVTIPLPEEHLDPADWTTIAENLFYFWPSDTVEITGGMLHDHNRTVDDPAPAYIQPEWSEYEHYDQHIIEELSTDEVIVTDMDKRPKGLRTPLIRMGSIVYPIPKHSGHRSVPADLLIDAAVGDYQITPSREDLVLSAADADRITEITSHDWAYTVAGDQLQAVIDAETTTETFRAATQVPDLVLKTVYGSSELPWIAECKNLPWEFRFPSQHSLDMDITRYHPQFRARTTKYHTPKPDLIDLINGEGAVPGPGPYWQEVPVRRIRLLDLAVVDHKLEKKLPAWHKRTDTIVYIIDKKVLKDHEGPGRMFTDVDTDLAWITPAEITVTARKTDTSPDKWLSADHLITGDRPSTSSRWHWSHYVDHLPSIIKYYTTVDKDLQRVRDHEEPLEVTDVVVTSRANLLKTKIFSPGHDGVLVIFGRHDAERIELGTGLPVHTLTELETALTARFYDSLDEQQRSDIALASVFSTKVNLSKYTDAFNELIIDPDSTDEEREVYQLLLERPSLNKLARTLRATPEMLQATAQLIIDEGTYDLPAGVVNLQLTPQLLINEHVPVALIKAMLRTEL